MAAIPGRDAAGSRRGAGQAATGRAVPGKAEPHGARSVLFLLLALTALSGVIDAVCFLGLGRVFTANMTGNIVIRGFAAAGALGLSVSASVTSLAVSSPGRSLAAASVRVSGVAAACCRRRSARRRFLSAPPPRWRAPRPPSRSAGAGYVTIAMLAFAMGIRNAAVARLSIPDARTTVLTTTLTGLAADSTLAGGTNPRALLRAGWVVAMLLGAIVGAVLFLHKGPGLPLVIAVAAAALTAVAAEASSAVRGYLDKKWGDDE